MAYYDVFGKYYAVEHNIESFSNCADKKVIDCPRYANSYKSCEIDGKKRTCCDTCSKYKECTDLLDTCPTLINDSTNLNDTGQCNSETWINCCASCAQQILNNNIVK